MATEQFSGAESGATISQQLRRRIFQAHQQPAHSQALRLCAQRYHIRYRHQPAQLAVQKIAEFIERYLTVLPELIDEFISHCQRLKWLAMIDKVQHSVHHMLLKTADQSGSCWGLLDWLDKTYVVHRLIEELHDHLWCSIGQPLLTWNMAAANLVVYDVIGERHAKHLEAAVQEMSQLYLTEIGLPEKQFAQTGEPAHWNCFFSQFQ